jgi:uncharacterized protein YkwD
MMTLTKYAWLVAGSAIVVVLSGCGGGASIAPSPSPTPTPAPTPAPAATPTPTPAANPTPTPAPAPTAAECPFGNYKSAVAAEINAIRSRPQICGGVAYPAVGGLGWNGQLESAADKHSTDMAVNNFFAHPGSDGSRIGARASAAGYAYSKVGENIAAGQSSAAQVSADWLASASHCANMMTASFVDIGVSCKANSNTTYQYYWTLVMGNR